MRWATRKVMNDEGVSTALRVFADEAKQRARELFMLATNSTLSLDRTCPAYLIGRRCLGGSDDGCPLCDVPGRDHIEMYDHDGEAKFYVMHVYEMSGSTNDVCPVRVLLTTSCFHLNVELIPLLTFRPSGKPSNQNAGFMVHPTGFQGNHT